MNVSQISKNSREFKQALVDKEVAHTGLSDLRVVGSMHERKSPG
jgi:hypothetical protein